jgi:hypothetical protein
MSTDRITACLIARSESGAQPGEDPGRARGRYGFRLDQGGHVVQEAGPPRTHIDGHR